MKETRLQEEAYIYKKRKGQGEKQKWKELGRREKLQYFKDYYLKKVVIGAVVAGFGIWLLSVMLSPKEETALYIAMINSASLQETEGGIAENLADILECEAADSIVIDSSYFMQLDGMDQGSLGSIQKMSAQAYSGMLDIVIADEEEFHYFARQGYFMDLAEALPTNLYSHLSDYIYLDQMEREEGDSIEYGEKLAYGIYLKDFARFAEMETGMENPVFGIVANTEKRKNAVKTLKYLTK